MQREQLELQLAEPAYSTALQIELEEATPIRQLSQLRQRPLKNDNSSSKGAVRIEYKSSEHYRLLATQFGLMPDLKAGIPRTAYRGVVTFRYLAGRRVFLHPAPGWLGYELGWGV